MKKGVDSPMFVAIMSDHEVSLSDVKDEITKLGFQVVGSELEDFDDIPRHVMIWIMFRVNRIQINPSLPTWYVRVASTTQPLNKTYFRVIGSPWWVAAYYHISMWVRLKWEKANLTNSSLRERKTNKDQREGVSPQMYAAILCDHEVPFEDVRKAIEERGFQVARSELEERDYPPNNLSCLMLFNHRRFGTRAVHRRYVRIASIENEGPEKFFYAVNCPWWSTIYHTVLWEAILKWEKAKAIFSS
jgi:hypothetical protein